MEFSLFILLTSFKPFHADTKLHSFVQTLMTGKPSAQPSSRPTNAPSKLPTIKPTGKHKFSTKPAYVCKKFVLCTAKPSA